MSQLLSNAKWLTLAQIARILIQILGLTFLVRILPPSDYGIIAIAQVITNMALLVRDFGTSASIIQAKSLDLDVVNSLHRLNLKIGGGIFLIVIIIAPGMAHYYDESKLYFVLPILALAFPVTSLTLANQAVMERDQKFKDLAIIETGSQFAAFALVVILALSGAGVFSLAIQPLVAATVSGWMLYKASAWRYDSSRLVPIPKNNWTLSKNLTLFNIVNYFSRNLDVVVIGKSAGSVALGYYSIAYKLMLFPLQSLTFIANRALLPVLSQAQSENKQALSTYLSALLMISILTFPAALGLWAVREDFVRLVYGLKWMPTSEIIFWLAPISAIQSILATTGTVLIAKGRSDLLLKVGIGTSILVVGSFFVGINEGAVGVAKFYFIAHVIVFLPCMYVTFRVLGSNLKPLLYSIWPATACTSMMLLSIFGFSKLHSPFGLYLELGLKVLLGAMVYTVILALFFPRVFKRLTALAGKSGT